jgi:hypothetical protein
MSLFSTLAEYFMYSHLPHFLHIAAMLCCSENEEYFDEYFYACETPGQLLVARWCPFHCLVLSELVISFCNKIRCNKPSLPQMNETPWKETPFLERPCWKGRYWDEIHWYREIIGWYFHQTPWCGGNWCLPSLWLLMFLMQLRKRTELPM